MAAVLWAARLALTSARGRGEKVVFGVPSDPAEPVEVQVKRE
jgi:hypothetical protein